jgi:hypothetical protein
MIQHVVVWKIKEEFKGTPKHLLIQEFKQRLESLGNEIDEIMSLSVSINTLAHGPQASDLCLVSTHESFEALQKYANHPKHLEVVTYAKNIVEERRVVDAEIL